MTRTALPKKQTRHKKLHEALEKCREETQMGVGIATAFAHQKILPAMYGKMLLGGARSGELVQVTENLARRTAQEAAELPVGTQLALTGRLQSREYIKMLGTTAERRTAYEISAILAEPVRE